MIAISLKSKPRIKCQSQTIVPVTRGKDVLQRQTANPKPFEATKLLLPYGNGHNIHIELMTNL